MHVDRSRHGARLALPVLWVAILVVACFTVATADAAVGSSKSQPKLAGTWSGKYSGGYSGTFVLRWKQSGSRLTGSIRLSNPPGTFPITGSVRGSTITFGAVGAGATYTGSVSGRSMSGRYMSKPSGGSWSARKTS